MNGFKIFATMSLVDAISNPLAKIQSAMKSAETASGSLSNRLGRLATAFGKVAAAGAIFLGGLGAMTGEAIAFESKMADVAKVVNFETPAELGTMSRDIQDLSLHIPIAAEGFADIVAAAAQSGVAKDDLIDFSVQAAKMGVAFDIAAGEASKTMADWRAGMGLSLQQTYSLADSVNHLANNMNATAPAISRVLNRIGAVGKAAGFTEQQLAALAATGLSTGASDDIVGTGLNSIFATLSQGTSMSKEAAQAFKSLGINVAALSKNMQIDAQGTIMGLMEAIAALPKEKQLSVITSAFGQLSLKSIAPMVGNLGNLRQALGLVGDAANYAGSMEGEYAARSATTANSIQLMKNAFNVLAITIGTYFLPVVDMAAKAIGGFIQLLISASRTEVGGFLLKLAAGIAAALVGVTGLIAAFALLKPLLLILGLALLPVIKPILLIAGAVALLSLAWKHDFLGLATMAREFAGKVKLVFQGVYAIFSTLKDGRGELSAELAKKIEAAGLMNLVTTVSRAVYRVMTFFKGLASTFKITVGPAFSRLGEAFRLLLTAIQPLFGHLARLGGSLTSVAGQTDTAPWLAWGQVIGDLAGTALGWFVDVVGMSVSVLTTMLGIVGWLNNGCSKFGAVLGDLIFTVVSFHQAIISAFVSIGSLISETLSGAIEAISNFNLIDAGMGLINGFTDGIRAGAGTLIDAVSGILGQVRAFLPFSDAQVGPLSNLSASGMAFIDTFAAGIKAKASALVDTVRGMLSSVRAFLPFSDAQVGPLSNLTASGRALPGTLARGVLNGALALMAATDNMLNGLNLAPPYFEMPGMNFGTSRLPGGHLPEPSFQMQDADPLASPFRAGSGSKQGGKTIHLHIGKIELPNVEDADGFIAALENIVEQRV